MIHYKWQYQNDVMSLSFSLLTTSLCRGLINHFFGDGLLFLLRSLAVIVTEDVLGCPSVDIP